MDPTPLGRQALEIWLSGVDAVRSERLLQSAVRRKGDRIAICDEQFSLGDIGKIAVVGGGKAGAGMAAALENVLGQQILDEKVTGWINVPADCVRPLHKIHLHAARPAGVNEPTAEGVVGANQILEIVEQLGPRDLCLVLISGGGSALLPAPVPEISLADKQDVTRFLMHAGATIHELNTVRKQLSRIKGGGLLRHCRAGRTIALLISDVIGDPLDIIASGPTVEDHSTAADAIAVLEKYAGSPPDVPQTVLDYLKQSETEKSPHAAALSPVTNHVIGNNRMAVAAAAARARELGYAVHDLGSDNAGEANECGIELANLCRSIRDDHQIVAPPVCVISGGEPVVHVVPTDKPRKGGRNQQLVLAALELLWHDGLPRIAILSGGTDGEDGPTDAAGALADTGILEKAIENNLDPRSYLAINDSYTFFDACGGLIKTGPTHTNVMDLRVAVIS
ncbi:Putative hydroxypyruvate reductase [Symmachiella dynata]|uniref:glycerate kinase type-2 family protein n=1 Tax=Symmachiella dynata TaxID=2527995 RepID=UPI0011897F81|nr:DUF4147 domain-containing protein [Symmachiella dynata]QDT49720.1 Putative hydroxypyruvate reductase [Symmachiella dynata]